MSAINNTFTDNFIFFWQLGEPNDYLSNWYPAPFVSEGIRYANTEQYMMAKKALLFKDFAVYSRILEVTDPAKIKYYGKLVGGFDAATWNKAKEEIMLNGNLAKFRCNYTLAAALRATKDATLAEASPKDLIWGIGLTADDPKALNPYYWRGQNLLGKTLMKVREMI